MAATAVLDESIAWGSVVSPTALRFPVAHVSFQRFLLLCPAANTHDMKFAASLSVSLRRRSVSARLCSLIVTHNCIR